MIRVTVISLSSSVFFATFKAPVTTACIFLHHGPWTSSPTLTPTGRDARTHGGLRRGTASTLAMLLSPGHRNASPRSRVQEPKQSTGPSQMLSPNAAGFDSSWASCPSQLRRPPWCTATTSPPCTWRPIRFTIAAPNISSWIFTSCARKLLSATFGFYMFLQVNNLQT